MAQMARLRDAAIHVYLIAGNHDAASKITKALHLPEKVRMLRHDQPETVRLDDMTAFESVSRFAGPQDGQSSPHAVPAPRTSPLDAGV